jgi:serine/threonine-protein kinase
MELLEGRTLREVLAKEAPLDPARAVALMLQISAAVAAAHEAGIIHRDLKPANVFIVQRADVPAVVKVLDFGIAKLAADSLDEDDRMTLTQFGAMIGTPRYMSPEQCDGAELTPAADVYSLGVILYEMLTGAVPFSGSTPLAIAMKHTSELPRSPREIVASIPPALEELVLQTLEKNPQNRPPDADAFGRELLETAERLGLEHAAIATSPNIAALRNAGTESPSGRLVIDISRLRESMAANPDLNEVTVVRPTALAPAEKPVVLAAGESLLAKPAFWRRTVPLRRSFTSKQQLMALAVIIAAALLVGATVALRIRNASSTQAVVAATPTPTVEPSPSPSPSPSPTPAPQRVARPSPTPKKKQGGFVNKVKRIFKNPF